MYTEQLPALAQEWFWALVLSLGFGSEIGPGFSPDTQRPQSVLIAMDGLQAIRKRAFSD